MWFVLIAAGAGGFTVAMLGETLPEILGAVAGAFVGVMGALGELTVRSSPVGLTPGAVVDAAAAALWVSMLAWLAVLWWERGKPVERTNETFVAPRTSTRTRQAARRIHRRMAP